jgi:hypothetical protein
MSLESSSEQSLDSSSPLPPAEAWSWSNYEEWLVSPPAAEQIDADLTVPAQEVEIHNVKRESRCAEHAQQVRPQTFFWVFFSKFGR